ncbi:MAG: hypothetical protein ACRC1M_07425 [Methanobacteriaceae archaeon]
MISNKKQIKNNYVITKLTPNHDLSNFDCGFSDLNDFIQNDALIQQNANLNVTYLVLFDNNVLPYFSILSDNILFKDLSIYINDLDEFAYEYYPAIKIGRFAVDINHQN